MATWTPSTPSPVASGPPRRPRPRPRPPPPSPPAARSPGRRWASAITTSGLVPPPSTVRPPAVSRRGSTPPPPGSCFSSRISSRAGVFSSTPVPPSVFSLSLQTLRPLALASSAPAAQCSAVWASRKSACGSPAASSPGPSWSLSPSLGLISCAITSSCSTPPPTASTWAALQTGQRPHRRHHPAGDLFAAVLTVPAPIPALAPGPEVLPGPAPTVSRRCRPRQAATADLSWRPALSADHRAADVIAVPAPGC